MRQRIWLELIVDFDLNMLSSRKTNAVPDVLSRKPIVMYLTQQKEIREDIKRLRLEVQLTRMTARLMELWFRFTLTDVIKEAKNNNGRLKRLRDKMKTGKKPDISMCADGSLRLRGRLCAQRRY